MPFNLNWKELLLISAFLIGGVAIVRNIATSSASIADNTVNLTPENTTELAAVDNSQRETENPNKEDFAAPTNEIKQEDLTTSNVASSQTTSVESPLSNITTKSVTPSPSASTVKTIAIPEKKVTEKAIPTKSTTTTKTIAPTTAKTTTATKAENRSVAPPVTVTPSVVKSTTNDLKAKSVEATPSTTLASGNYYLIAASRNTFEDAQVSFDELKRKGYNPLLLSPIKSKGINNYRIAIFKNNDRKKVEEFKAQNSGMTLWIDQR